MAQIVCATALATLRPMWTLYGSDGSGSAAVEMALLRCDQPYRVVRASTWEPESAQAPLRQANPLGQIPTLQGADGSVLTESAAIGVIDYPERWCASTEAADLERLRLGARARLHRLWELFADQFAAPGPFLGGDAPGALDLLAAVVSRWSGARAHLKVQRPELHALLLRVERDPALAPVVVRHWPA